MNTNLAAAMIALVALALPAIATAGPETAPVKRIMKIAEARWATTEGTDEDYFDHIKRDFSKSFVKAYKEAAKHPATDGGTSPFDWDAVIDGQDGCPLKDIDITPGAEQDGKTVVEVHFRRWDCADDAAIKAKVETVKFDLVTEKGKPLIADIHHLGEDGKWDSLVSTMAVIANQ